MWGLRGRLGFSFTEIWRKEEDEREDEEGKERDKGKEEKMSDRLLAHRSLASQNIYSNNNHYYGCLVPHAITRYWLKDYNQYDNYMVIPLLHPML